MTLASLIVNVQGNIVDFENKIEKAEKDLDKFSKGMDRIGEGMAKIGAGLTAAVTLPILAVGAASIKMGMDAVESENLFEVSFGGMADQARQWSVETSKALGLNQYELRKSSGMLFTMFESMKIGKQASFDMATGLTQLSADMASFYNMKPEEAFQKLSAGITGETEPLKRLGILVDEQTTKTYAYTHGIAKQGAELTQQEKVLARYGSIMEQTSKAQGDLARTLDSPTNQLRIMRERLNETAITLGMALLPTFTRFLDMAKDLLPVIEGAVKWFSDLSPATQNTVIAIAALAAAIGPVLVVLGTLASSISSLMVLWPAVVAAFTVITGPIGLTVAAIAALTTAWMIWGDDITRITSETFTAVRDWFVGKFQAIADAVRAPIEKVKGFFKGLYDSVVGHSSVPDLIEGVGHYFGQLDDVMVQPTKKAIAEADKAFADWRKTMNWVGEEQMKAEAAALKFAAGVENASVGVRNLAVAAGAAAPAIQSMGLALQATSYELESKTIPLITSLPANIQSQGVSSMMSAGRAWAMSFGSTLKTGLGDTVMAALTGGGNVANSIGGLIGKAAFGEGTTKFLTSHATSMFGNLFGGAISSVIPGLGPLIGQLLGPVFGKVGDWFKGLFGADKKELEGRDVAKDFRDMAASMLSDTQALEAGNDEWKKSVIVVRDAYIAAGHTEQEALDVMARLWRAEKQGGGAVKQVIDEITGVTGGFEKVTKTATDTAAKGWDKVGVTAVRSFDEASAKLADLHMQVSDPASFERFTQILNDAAAAGVSDFAFLFNMIDTWQPPDKTVHIVSDWSDSGTYQGNRPGGGEGGGGVTLEDFLRRNPNDADRYQSAMAPVPGFQSNDPGSGVRGFASGTMGRYLDFGKGTPTVLHGRERVMTESEGRSERAGLQALADKLDRYMRDQPRALARAMQNALVQAGVA